MRIALMSVGLVIGGCAHVTHPAEVEEGLRVAVLGGGGQEAKRFSSTPADRSENTRVIYDFQIDVGYGWRFDDDLALLVELLLPFTGRDNSRQGFALPVHGGVDVYLQLVGTPFDAGVGVIAAVAPSVYWMAGERWQLAGPIWLSIDGSVRLGLYRTREGGAVTFPSVTPALTAGLAFGSLQVFLFGDVSLYPLEANRELVEGTDPVAWIYAAGLGAS